VVHAMPAPETMQGFNCCCPLRCKGTKSLGKYLTHDDALARVMHHLKTSDKHWLDDDSASQIIAEKADCIWEDTIDIYDEGVVEPPQEDRDNRRSRSRSRQTQRSHKGKGGKGGKGQHHQNREDAIVKRASDRVLANVVWDTQDQRAKVFQFAKVLGKCEAVIRTATNVARQAAMCFEDCCLL
jgi:hypothetical protein